MSVHREKINPNSMDGVPDLRDQMSFGDCSPLSSSSKYNVNSESEPDQGCQPRCHEADLHQGVGSHAWPRRTDPKKNILTVPITVSSSKEEHNCKVSK